MQFDFEYITPKSHLELLSGIVATDLSTFKEDVKDCLAASFHCDASMDRTQKDNEYMVLKTIDRDGKESLNYVGLGFVTGQGAQGHFESWKVRAEDTIGFHNSLKISNHMTTDGGNIKAGQHHGLWKFMAESIAQGLDFPMWKSVCAVHSSALAYKDLCREFSEADAIIRRISGVSSYFHQSAARTTALEEYTRSKGFPFRRCRKHFETRWSQFTDLLVDSILVLWRALLAFCELSDDQQANVFWKLLSNKNNLLLQHLLGDALFHLKCIQKTLQADNR